MTRNELAAAVQAKGIATPKNPFFMSAPALQALLDASFKSKKGSEKIAMIKTLADKGLTRAEIVAAMKEAGMHTTIGYVTNAKNAYGFKVRPAVKRK